MLKKLINDFYMFETNCIGNKPVFIEVGSFTGKNAIELRTIYPDSRTTIYEASKVNYKILCKNIPKMFIKDGSISIAKKAVLDRHGTILFHDFTTKSSNSIFTRAQEKKSELSQYKVRVVDILDVITEPISVLFLNCEGSEIGILNRLIERAENNESVKQIAVEFHPKITGLGTKKATIERAKKYYIVENIAKECYLMIRK